MHECMSMGMWTESGIQIFWTGSEGKSRLYFGTKNKTGIWMIRKVDKFYKYYMISLRMSCDLKP